MSVVTRQERRDILDQTIDALNARLLLLAVERRELRRMLTDASAERVEIELGLRSRKPKVAA